MSCKLSCSRCFLYFLNVLYITSGMFLLVAGSLVITNTSSLREFIIYRPEIAPIFQGIYMMISAGVGLFLLGIIGCAAAVRQNRCGLGLFLALTVTILLIQWIGAIVTFVNYPEGKTFVKKTMDIYSNEEILSPCLEIEDQNKRELCFVQKKFKVEKSGWADVLMNGRWTQNSEEREMLYEIASPMVSVVWEDIQKKNQCCGLSGQNDWIDSHFQKIPATCCNEDNLTERSEIARDNRQAETMKLIFAIFISFGAVVGDYCDSEETDSAIFELHDDLDDDDDGSISSTENRAFINEYGGGASAIGALLEDNDGLVSKDEFLKAWKRSTVHNWTTDDVVTWLRGADLGFRSDIADQISAIFQMHRVTGRCFPLLAKLEQTFLKKIGIRQHLLRRKIALRSMDAILFGPPVNDSLVKDLILAVLAVFMIFSVTFIIRLKRQFKDVKSRLKAESTRLEELDNMWKEYAETPLDHDSVSTVLDLPAELSSLATLKKQNDQLQASLEEAHKELRKMQNGYSLDKIVVTSDVKEILIKTYRAEKHNLDFRKRDARKKEHVATENMKKLERANTNFFSSVRLLHSHQLDHLDAALMQAHKAIEDIVSSQKESHDRWRKIEKIFNIPIMRQKQMENGESSPDIYSTPILSERPPSSAARSIHNESLHQIALSNHHQNRAGVKPVSSIPSGLQLHGNSHSNETMSEDNSPTSTRPELRQMDSTISTDSCIYTQTGTHESERDTSEPPSRTCISEINGNSVASSTAEEESTTSLRSASASTHVKTKKPKFKLFDKRKLSYLSFRKNKSKKNE
ncbi:Oidioi.mRNA.OKI2018_I69.chr2.g4629.t2.cds [Oikopleura dioica]|uniref:Oidioi.mRNA.OKI2018_I69.chr2.g4629.t2.cds n=1 Tax=Oikopleura dioica TaxID=34765 RepID=A0ABN7SXY2_OIKDI|nr:Oidioi.mRNA.OKI2018_I69.chr2.g4629.t2.cds [Oikopleura dioica]